MGETGKAKESGGRSEEEEETAADSSLVAAEEGGVENGYPVTSPICESELPASPKTPKSPPSGPRSGKRRRGKLRAATPLPLRPVAAIVAAQICEGYNIFVLFPFVYSQVKWFGIADPGEEGTYTGLITCAFCVGQFFFSPMWGRLSDRIGCKLCLLFGMLGSMACLTLFGLASNFWVALSARLLGGVLNSNMGVMKAYLGRITDDTNQARAFSYLPLGFGLGVTAASSAAGILSEPDVALFKNCPFLPPCLLGVLMIFMTFLLTLALLPSEEKRKKEASLAEGSEKGGREAVASPRFSSFTPRWLTRQGALAIFLYGMIALVFVTSDEIIPLWTQFDRPLGLGLAREVLGMMLSVVGIVLASWTFFLMPTVQRHLGTTTSMRVGSLGVLAIHLLYCLLPHFPENLWVPMFIVLHGMRSMCGAMVFTGTMVMLNLSVSHSDLGLANGFGQSVASFSRAVGPASGGYSWTLTVRHPMEFGSWAMLYVIICIGITLLGTLLVSKELTDEKRIMEEDEVAMGLVNAASCETADEMELRE